MVRAGVVKHPDEWKWCGHDEIMGHRSRYTILSIERLLESLAMPSVHALRDSYELGIEETIERGELDRESAWTEALAVGDRDFVEGVAKETRHRSQFGYIPLSGNGDGWSVREGGVAYSSVSPPK